MGRIWLPMGPKPSGTPQGEREELKARLYEARYLVPDAESLDLQQLRDLVAFAEEKQRKQEQDDHLKAEAAAQLLESMDPAQRRGALREFIDWRRRKRQAAGLQAR